MGRISTANRSQGVEMETSNSSQETAKLPEWLMERADQMHRRVEGFVPYPFRHPEVLADYISLHQNDYLRLSSRPEVLSAKEEALRRYGNSFLASTIFTGGEGAAEHDALRALICDSMEAEDAILTTSGWTANVGLLEAIAKEGTPIYIDRKAHASIWDGAKLSSGHAVMVGHNDPVSLERRIRREGPGIICIDSVYSTTGAISHLPSYVEIAERTESVLMVDEAHGFGMFGAKGGGLAELQGVANRIHFRTLSFSKALGGHGGCIATSRHLAWFLTHRARPVVFSSAALPCDSAAHRKGLEILRAEPGLATNCLEMAQVLREEMEIRGIPTGTSRSQIVALQSTSDRLTCELYMELRERGILSAVFLDPAVPVGAGLLRFSIHAHCTRDDMVRTAVAMREALDVMEHRHGIHLDDSRQAA